MQNQSQLKCLWQSISYKSVTYATHLFVSLSLILVSNLAQGQEVPREVSPDFESDFSRAVALMNQSRYDSAQVVLNGMLAQTYLPISLHDLYYVHSLEAEIMYYNALFEQGLNLALRAREVSLKLNNDTLIGAADNLVGLLMMNTGRVEDALPYLRSAVNKLPQFHGNGFLSWNYQAIANIAECFLLLNNPDSVIAYSMLSLDEAEKLGRERGLGIAYWNLAEAYLIRGDLSSASIFSRKGLNVLENSPHRDVLQAHYATLMRNAEKRNLPDSALYFMDLGLKENTNEQNTDYSRSDFLNKAIDLSLRLGNVKRANVMITALRELERSFNEKEQGLRMNVLRDYYEKSQSLALTQERMEAQARQFELRGWIQKALIAVALLLLALVFFVQRFFAQRTRIQKIDFERRIQEERRVADLKAVQMRMEALNEERQRIASDLHDDIGASLSSIRIYADAANMQFESKPVEAHNLIQRIRESSAGIMDRMGDIVWSISPRNDGGENLIFRMKSLANQTLGAKGIEPHFKVSEGVSVLSLSLQARKNIYLIYKEAVNNIAKYSGAKEVYVRINLNDSDLIMSIIDNGKGFETNQLTQGNGLHNMNERALHIGGRLEITSQPGSGTEVTLTCEIAKIRDFTFNPVS